MSTGDGADDVAQLAALLTDLKARTGRSYGSLARRLGMNTSTLHRYCAGEAVPQDFAPLERLAEFCGAGPQERLELHRRWLRAVAARQRPRTAGTPDSVERPAAHAAPGSALAPEEPATHEHPATDGPGTDRPTDGRSTDGGPNTGRAATDGPPDTDPSATGIPAADGRPTTNRPVTGRPASDRPASGKPSANRPAADRPAAPAARPRPWHRRRRTPLLAALACAFLATLGTLSALPGDEDPPSGTARSSSTPPRTTAPAGPHPTPTASPSLPPSASASPHPASTPPDPRSGKPSPSAPGAPSPGGATEAAVPLTWTADSQAWAQGCGHDYVIGRPPAEVPPPPAAQDAGRWAAAEGAVHGRETNVEISVQGRSSTAVVLTALRVRVAGRTDPAPGNAYAMDQGCGGSISPRSFAVDLDKDRPVARPVPGNDSGTPIPAVRMPYRVSAEDPEVLLVTARTQACDCSWYLELDWSSQGRTGTVRIDDHGRPFRTRSITGLPRYMYDTSARQWTPYR
ncbi:helix-turn-helix domain-containing protein [Streptomyces sp. NPDC052016]|uniref:transcriptional regulator n=1 Tax=Streptomyces sp. NPDC052016 TaxID=3365680 RepID=UPI0037CCF302